MRVLVCGSREWNKIDVIRRELEAIGPCVVIQGGARGADRLACVVAQRLGYDVVEFPADWDRHGKAAGRIRNQQMLDEGKPEFALAFSVRQPLTTGTADMVRRLRGAGVPGKVIAPRVQVALFA